MTDPESIAESIIKREAETFALAHSPACGFEYRREKRVDLKLRLIAELKKAADHGRQELLEALKDLVAATEAEVNEKGGGGFVLARLTDARGAIARAEGGEPQ